MATNAEIFVERLYANEYMFNCLNFRIMPKGSKMTPAAASRIQSSAAKAAGGTVSKGSFSSRAQSAGAKNSK